MKRWESLGVTRIIWNRQSWTPAGGWKPYTGFSPHTDHAHIEIGSITGNPLPKCKGGSAGCVDRCPEFQAFYDALEPYKDEAAIYGVAFAAPGVWCYDLGTHNCRLVKGSLTSWSQHAYGRAGDVGVKTIEAGDRVRDWLFEELEPPPPPPEEGFLMALSEDEQAFVLKQLQRFDAWMDGRIGITGINPALKGKTLADFGGDRNLYNAYMLGTKEGASK